MNGPCILVVDPEPNTRSSLRALLIGEGYAVLETAEGDEALAMLSEGPADVVLCDVHQLKLDGPSLLERARQEGSDATFLVMTASASLDAAVESLRAGAESFLTKPLELRAVLALVHKALEKRLLLREAESLRARLREDVALIPGASLYEIERRAILRTLELVNGSTSSAAELLGISVRKIQYRLKEYGAGRHAKPSAPAQANLSQSSSA